MKCNNCGKKIKKKVSFCPNCGAPVDNNVDLSPTTDPLTNGRPKKRKKKFIIAIILVILLFLIIGSCGGNSDEPSSADDAQADNPKQSEATQKSDAEKEAEKLGIDVSEYENLAAAYASIGIDDIDDITNNNDGSYTVTYEDYYFVATVENGAVNNIMSGTIVFYSDGAAQEQVSNRIVTSTEFTWLTSYAEEDVKANLKSPKSAEFPGTILDANEWDIQKNGTSYTVSSWVDAQNSFGAQIRSNFVIVYSWDGNTENRPTLVSIKIE